MNILLIPDKFKGSLTAEAVIRALKEGLYAIDPSISTHVILASDGGEGFLEAVHRYLQPARMVCTTVDPLGRPIEAPYLLDKTQKTAYIELARASGLELLAPGDRKVMETSTYGTGLQIRHALQNGATRICLGLGGSATNDAGTGIAAALGCKFYNQSGEIALPRGKDLIEITDIHFGDRNKAISFIAVNDVQNPLFGKKGAACTYGKQKGATETQVKQLDAGLRHISDLVREKTGKDLALLPGSGAAGGTAYGLKAFLDTEYISGIEFILGLTDFFELISTRKIDCIITGEGKIDRQTLHGKLIKGITSIAARHHIPVLAICGKLDLDAHEIKELGLSAAIEIRDTGRSDDYNFTHAAALIRRKLPKLVGDFIQDCHTGTK